MDTVTLLPEDTTDALLDTALDVKTLLAIKLSVEVAPATVNGSPHVDTDADADADADTDGPSTTNGCPHVDVAEDDCARVVLMKGTIERRVVRMTLDLRGRMVKI